MKRIKNRLNRMIIIKRINKFKEHLDNMDEFTKYRLNKIFKKADLRKFDATILQKRIQNCINKGKLKDD